MTALTEAAAAAAAAKVVVWLSGNVVGSINEVAVRRAWLVPGWVTVSGRANHLGV